MKNVIMLHKTEDGNIRCQQITKKGKRYMETVQDDPVYWEDGGTIVLDELEEILDREI